MNEGELNIKATVDTSELERALKLSYQLLDVAKKSSDIVKETLEIQQKLKEGFEGENVREHSVL